MESMIVYASRHHGNTEKVVRYLEERYEITVVNGEEATAIDGAAYDLIGFASGIDFGKFYPPITELAERLAPGKFVYALYTCAKDDGKYGDQIREIAERTGGRYLGKFGCRGYNTYGPWKLIGGMNKSHPDGQELEQAATFYEQMLALSSGQIDL